MLDILSAMLRPSRMADQASQIWVPNFTFQASKIYQKIDSSETLILDSAAGDRPVGGLTGDSENMNPGGWPTGDPWETPMGFSGGGRSVDVVTETVNGRTIETTTVVENGVTTVTTREW